MFKRRSALSWMNVDSGEFVDWALPYLSARGLIASTYADPAQALRAFQTSFMTRQMSSPAVDATDEKQARNFKQAWEKHLKRKAAKGKQKPYSFEMDVQVHGKLKSIAKDLGLPIYRTLTMLILDADKLRKELMRQKKEETDRLKKKQPNQDAFAENKTKQIKALQAKVAAWEKQAELLAYDNAKYWIALQAAGLVADDRGATLTPDQQAKAQYLQHQLHSASMQEVKASLGSLRLNLPKELTTKKTEAPPNPIPSTRYSTLSRQEIAQPTPRSTAPQDIASPLTPLSYAGSRISQVPEIDCAEASTQNTEKDHNKSPYEDFDIP